MYTRKDLHRFHTDYRPKNLTLSDKVLRTIFTYMETHGELAPFVKIAARCQYFSSKVMTREATEGLIAEKLVSSSYDGRKYTYAVTQAGIDRLAEIMERYIKGLDQ